MSDPYTSSKLPQLPQNYCSSWTRANIVDTEEKFREYKNKTLANGAIGFNHMKHTPFAV